MKKKLALLFALCNLFIYAQKNNSYENFGRITQAEADLTYYQQDSSANALVLHENAETQFLLDNNSIIISTSYYFKIKLFNKEAFDHAKFEINLHNTERRSEKLEDIKGFTHNGIVKTGLQKENIYTNRINDNWKEVSFTMPNLKDGSIIEVMYTVRSPFMFNLTDWYFQSDIPKLYSEYKASIPGNFVYNRKKIGPLRLSKNQSTIKKDCFYVPNNGTSDCEVITYAMTNVPAFIEEAYMTNKFNFLAAINFELMEYNSFRGGKEKYSKTWNDVDKEFRTDNDLGKQLRKFEFFNDKLPAELATAKTDIAKAKIIHRFITEHYVYNDKYGLWGDVNIKDAYEDRVTNATTINLSLINALKAAGFDVKMMLLSTRSNGLATKVYPVVSDFNYAVAKLEIGDKSYLLDATDKNAPFGLLPYRCLNSYGRVMDFESESYWYDIVPEPHSKQQSYVKLSMDELGELSGQIRNINYKYDALERRNKIKNLTEESIIEKFEAQFTNIYVENYEVKNLHDVEKPLTETFDIVFEKADDNANILFFNPFFGNRFESNPFKQEDRIYPVDFGHPRKFYLTLTMDIADGYSIKSVPVSKKFVLEEDSGSYTLLTMKKENYFVQLKSSFILSKAKYFRFEYLNLKQLFSNVVAIQNTDIVIDKDLSK